MVSETVQPQAKTGQAALSVSVLPAGTDVHTYPQTRASRRAELRQTQEVLRKTQVQGGGELGRMRAALGRRTVGDRWEVLRMNKGSDRTRGQRIFWKGWLAEMGAGGGGKRQ